jgi:hypothetical protein
MASFHRKSKADMLSVRARVHMQRAHLLACAFVVMESISMLMVYGCGVFVSV